MAALIPNARFVTIDGDGPFPEGDEAITVVLKYLGEGGQDKS